MAFDDLKKKLEDLMDRATPPQDRREAASQMRDTLVQAKMGLSEMQASLDKDRQRLQIEERELETVRRRKQMALDINDAETVKIAEQFEATHAKKVELLRRKVAVQEDEVRMAEADVEAMSRDLKAAVKGTGDFGPTVRAPSSEADPSSAPLASEIEALGRARRRAEHEAAADAELEALKRQMGK
jgi:hypothetical protein